MLTRFEQDLRLLTPEQMETKYGNNWESRHLAGDDIQPVRSSTNLTQESTNLTQPSTASGVAVALEMLDDQEPSPCQYSGKAFGRYLMIRRVEETHSARLLMPERHHGVGDIGVIESIGEKVEHLRPGMMVLFDQFATVGREIRLLDAESVPATFLLCEDPDILAVLERVKG